MKSFTPTTPRAPRTEMTALGIGLLLTLVML